MKQEYKYLPETDFAGRTKLKGKPWDEFIAVMFLRNANYPRFGSMMVEFCKAYANEDDKYSKDIYKMIDITRQ